MIELRQARPADEDELALLDRATWTSLSSPAPPPGPEWRFFDEKMPPENVLVALVDGEIAGYVRLDRATRHAASGHVLKINGLSVGEPYRRHGVGRVLIEGAIEAARARGARRLTLRVLGHNEPARRLYESAGFVVEGLQRDEFFLDGDYRDDVLMAYEL